MQPDWQRRLALGERPPASVPPPLCRPFGIGRLDMAGRSLLLGNAPNSGTRKPQTISPYLSWTSANFHHARPEGMRSAIHIMPPRMPSSASAFFCCSGVSAL
jgi:hypothetical protein